MNCLTFFQQEKPVSIKITITQCGCGGERSDPKVFVMTLTLGKPLMIFPKLMNQSQLMSVRPDTRNVLENWCHSDVEECGCSSGQK
ncbi:hypothetical protein TNIN_479861 [Trichonephila inaurata madagascariensis]|uniref:Uncharacterized protein n=1 Tax=Trichonephila inaurata madagascariensis TaxID=2747483 RepID=A0A8X6Y252_9ARAC|nr:hypothetical protein TNIN_479861 [Trichonephila inaurata madagascariensis]